MTARQLAVADLLVSELALETRDIRQDAEMAMNSHLSTLCDLSQSHVWDSIDFYSRPAVVEAAEIEAHEINSKCIWIELEDCVDYVSGGIIEDYYEGGKIWSLQ